MADNHYSFSRSGGAGFRLGRAHEALDNALQWLVAERDAMTQMLDGDGSQDAHYAGVKDSYGFATDAEAKAAFLELDSVVAKLTSNASQSSVFDAVKQFLSRFRN